MYTLISSSSSPISTGVYAENPMSQPRSYNHRALKAPTIHAKAPAALRSMSPASTTSVRSNSTSTSSVGARKTNLDFEELSQLCPASPRSGEKDLWYVVAAACLIAWRRESAVGDLWKYLSENPTAPKDASESPTSSSSSSSKTDDDPSTPGEFKTESELQAPLLTRDVPKEIRSAVKTTSEKIRSGIEKVSPESNTSHTSSSSTAPENAEQATLLKHARRLREGLLKSSVLVGFPRAINGMMYLQKAIQSQNSSLHLVLSDDASLRAAMSPGVKYDRGQAFFGKIYDKHTELVLANMSASSGGDLSYYAVSSVYGELMAETSILDGPETVLLEFACCLASGCSDQAKGHMYGAKNFGAKGEEVRGVVALVTEMAMQLGVGDFEEYLLEMPFLEKAQGW